MLEHQPFGFALPCLVPLVIKRVPAVQEPTVALAQAPLFRMVDVGQHLLELVLALLE